MSTARGGHEAILTELLAPHWNIPVAAKDRYGYTAFSFAAEQGHVHVMRKLLSFTPMHKTTILDSKDICGRTPLPLAAAFGQHAAVKFLLEQNDVTIDSMDNACQTPLLCAARSGHVMIFRALLRKGALVDSPDSRGRTPLSYAAEQGHSVVVRRLLAGGTQVGMRDKNGESPMEWANCRGRGRSG